MQLKATTLKYTRAHRAPDTQGESEGKMKIYQGKG